MVQKHTKGMGANMYLKSAKWIRLVTPESLWVNKTRRCAHFDCHLEMMSNTLLVFSLEDLSCAKSIKNTSKDVLSFSISTKNPEIFNVEPKEGEIKGEGKAEIIVSLNKDYLSNGQQLRKVPTTYVFEILYRLKSWSPGVYKTEELKAIIEWPQNITATIAEISEVKQAHEDSLLETSSIGNCSLAQEVMHNLYKIEEIEAKTDLALKLNEDTQSEIALPLMNEKPIRRTKSTKTVLNASIDLPRPTLDVEKVENETKKIEAVSDHNKTEEKLESVSLRSEKQQNESFLKQSDGKIQQNKTNDKYESVSLKSENQQSESFVGQSDGKLADSNVIADSNGAKSNHNTTKCSVEIEDSKPKVEAIQNENISETPQNTPTWDIVIECDCHNPNSEVIAGEGFVSPEMRDKFYKQDSGIHDVESSEGDIQNETKENSADKLKENEESGHGKEMESVNKTKEINEIQNETREKDENSVDKLKENKKSGKEIESINETKEVNNVEEGSEEEQLKMEMEQARQTEEEISLLLKESLKSKESEVLPMFGSEVNAGETTKQWVNELEQISEQSATSSESDGPTSVKFKMPKEGKTVRQLKAYNHKLLEQVEEMRKQNESRKLEQKKLEKKLENLSH